MASKYETLLPDNIDELLYVKLPRTHGIVYGGYKTDYLSQNLSEIEQMLIVCQECTGVMKEASSCNGNIICLVCKGFSSNFTPVKSLQDYVAKLNIRCPLLRDCDWNGKMLEAQKHLTNCLYFKIKCAKCKQVFPRGETDEHKTNFCAMREIKCGYCGYSVIANELETHLTSCLRYPVPCLNNCGTSFPRIDTAKHLSGCQLELVDCPFAKYGCKSERMARGDLLTHKKNNLVEHTDLSLDRIEKLEKENFRLNDIQKSIVWELKLDKHLEGVEWEMTNVKKGEIGRVEGPTFYVDSYKLNVYVVCTLGTRKFFLKRVEGEFDRDLADAFVTKYQLVIVDKQNYKQSKCLVGAMNCQLKIGLLSPYFVRIHPLVYQEQITTPDDTLHLKFYFYINTLPNF